MCLHVCAYEVSGLESELHAVRIEAASETARVGLYGRRVGDGEVEGGLTC